MRKIFCASDDAVEDLLNLLDKKDLLSCDTETDGLSPYLNKLWSIQIGDRDTAILFPFNALNEHSRNLLREYLNPRTIIAHNAKFDLKFLYINGFDIENSYDTYEIEKILFAGKYFTFTLKDLLFRRFQVNMDKEVRKIFYSEDQKEKSEFQKRVDEFGEWGAWDKKAIDYALGDIEYLHEIFDGQQQDAKDLGMTNLVWLENNLVPVVARMENRGVRLDSRATKKFLSRISLRRDELRQSIFGLLEKNYNISWRREYSERMKLWDSWKFSHEIVKEKSNKLRIEGDRRKKTEEALAMVAASDKKKPFAIKPKEESIFSPTSPLKLQQALTETVGFPVTTTGKEWLEENIHLHDAIADLVEFRKFDKLCQFCELTEDINEVTGFIHASFNQNGAKSGRFSCVPMNTKALTKDGWKDYNELSIGEEILAYDMENKIQIWTPLLNKTKLEKQVVGSVGTEFQKFRCTDNHNWIVLKGHDTTHNNKLYGAKESIIEAKDIKFGHRIVMNSSYVGNFSTNLDIYSTQKYGTDYIKLITKMNKHQLDAFILGFLLADGHNSKPTKIGSKMGWQWTQARTVTREQLLLATYLQYNGRIGVEKHFVGNNLNQKPSDRVTLCHSPYTAVRKIWKSETIEDVWCPTTKYGTWIMRQGDLITITGNCSNPNLQQIPAKSDEAKEFRALFRPIDGYKFVGADLAGIELVIIAYFSKEQVLIDAINNDLDLHCFTMSLFLNCPYESVLAAKNSKGTSLFDEVLLRSRKEFEAQFSMPELAKKESLIDWVKTLRDYTKTLTYGLAYGLSAFGLSRKFHCSYEDAELFIARFFQGYPSIKKFLGNLENIGYERMYAVNPLGRRRWFLAPKKRQYDDVEKEVIKFLDKQKRLWDSVTEEEWTELITKALEGSEKEYKGKINSVKRQAGNFFPQSMCADMIKLAMIRFDRNFVGDKKEGLILTVHDELIANVLDEHTEQASEILEEAMAYAVKKFMPNIRVEVKTQVMDKWTK